jgi:cytoskeletal protein RodZ
MAGFGETLHQARAHLGVTLKEAEQATRINRRHLAALEEENFAALPPLIYQRGILRNYAVYLQLDPSKLIAMFEEAHGISEGPGRGGVVAVPPIDMPSHWAPNFAIIGFAVVLSAIVFAWVYSAFVAAPPEFDATPTLAVPTATPFEADLPMPTKPPVTEAPPTAAPTTTPAPPTAADPSTSTRKPGGDNQRGAAADDEAEPTVELPAPTEPAPTEPPAVDQSGMTSISVTALVDIYIKITADGVVKQEGMLLAGESTPQYAGAAFNVFTTTGSQTLFTNACGDQFTMGTEEGEVAYELGYNEDSCPPVT